ncbi:phage tail protein [Lactonifactor sp. BIOML-A3]|uniref:phage tail protein n=1 Tax=unclassified Lactonifactor TaxID=2636670 RepID=UPI0012AFD556|nr:MULTISPECIES: phage tail protein [unclassified Lactonifactor]MSA01758.1 phage tail protein [Lactonifactor sp. BIOML-A5]MSA08272.1 phage tail protein [Lactonifactor sp. BIOML-A4]MSA12694.1 phage tail protein [Lactonifactor sp. BIOML-A3]MSA17334.1 phage tail protein [Lactonifactor sp. BIOML-A2]MSA37911.1 phage tail protein [Lactonifactor sp. BIOML-A1]
MADNFGLKIGVEGEKEFKKALSDINQTFKVLGSEMKLVSSEFDKQDKSVAAVAARNEVLNKAIDAQKDKIATLESALKNAADSFGENDRRTQNWAIQLNNAKAELNGMERELDNSADAADDLGDELKESGDEAESSGGKFEKLGSVLKGVGAAMGAVALAAGAAAVKLGKEVISAYADFEQLVGGVDTLFGDASQTVQNYAANAFKTAGLSANEYMETVTGFSASLIQSLGGDTAKAAEVADMAITDMADNANKMGTDLSAIQTAYQGFAKQNYTMLDNLKLGYGGTKSEMERLLADAEKISGIKYDLSSFSDLTEAIHVIQTEMGITGTTAKEATETISGSMAGMQSAIDNLMAGLGNADADIEMLIGNVVEAFGHVVDNVVPVIENIVKALPPALDGILRAIGDLLPTLLSTVVDLFTQVLETLLSLLPELIPAAVDAVLTIVGALIDNLPLLIDAAVQLITALVMGLGSALPELIPAAVEAIITIVQGLLDSMDQILEAAFAIIQGLAEGLLNALPELIDALPEIIMTIIDFITNNLPLIIEMGIELTIQLAFGLIKAIPQLVARLPEIVAAIVTGLGKAVGAVFEIGKNIVTGLWEGIKSLGSWIADKVSGFFSGIVDGAKSLLGIHSPSTVFAGIGENMGLGIGMGFTDAMRGVEKDIAGAIPTDFDLDMKTGIHKIMNDTSLDVRKTVEHTGVIRVEGVNSTGEMTSVIDIIVDRLRQEVRV